MAHETKYTPGPLVAFGTSVFSETDGGHCVALCDTDNAPVEVMRANATLYSAAPDLYAALMELKSELRDLSFDHPVVRQIDAALAKARGEA